MVQKSSTTRDDFRGVSIVRERLYMEELGFINKHKNTAYKTMGEFYSKLTEELDAALDDEHSDRCRHYVLANDYCLKNKCLAIRVYGTTVGNIRFDDGNVIQNIVIDSDSVIGCYMKDVNMQLQKYVGQKMIFY